MVSCGTSVYRPLQMAERCLAAAPTFFFITKNHNHVPPCPLKQINSTHLSYSFSSSPLGGFCKKETDQSRGFGFVTMSTVEEAKKAVAVEMFHRFDLNGRLLTVNKAAPRGTQPERRSRTSEPSFRIYVGNLAWQVDDACLEQVFSQHGKVINARVMSDRETGRSCEMELNDALAALDGQSLDERTIRVNVAKE